MPKPLDIYLDTSVINFLFADDAPEKKEITLEFFETFITRYVYNVFISDLVITEIEATPDASKSQQLLAVIENYPIKFVATQSSDEIKLLAKIYLDHKVIPQSKIADAYHIAIAVVNKMDVLLSWNYRHLANVKRESKILALNALNNYFHPIRIVTPMELMDYEST